MVRILWKRKHETNIFLRWDNLSFNSVNVDFIRFKICVGDLKIFPSKICKKTYFYTWVHYFMNFKEQNLKIILMVAKVEKIHFIHCLWEYFLGRYQVELSCNIIWKICSGEPDVVVQSSSVLKYSNTYQHRFVIRIMHLLTSRLFVLFSVTRLYGFIATISSGYIFLATTKIFPSLPLLGKFLVLILQVIGFEKICTMVTSFSWGRKIKQLL